MTTLLLRNSALRAQTPVLLDTKPSGTDPDNTRQPPFGGLIEMVIGCQIT